MIERSVIVFTGSRGWRDADVIHTTIQTLRRPFLGIVGEADGFDTLVWEALAEFGLPRMQFHAKWRKEGEYRRWAGHERNDLMLAWALRLQERGWRASGVSGWDGNSPGTKSMVKKMKDKGLSVLPIAYLPQFHK